LGGCCAGIGAAEGGEVGTAAAAYEGSGRMGLLVACFAERWLRVGRCTRR
jgi:hypothetical protein